MNGYRSPHDYIDMLARELSLDDCPTVGLLLSDYASALGFIEGSEKGAQWLKDDCAFWKELAMRKITKPLPPTPERRTAGEGTDHG